MAGLMNALNKACWLYGNTFGRLAKHRIILCYHNVGDVDAVNRGWLGKNRSIKSSEFEAQMAWIKSNFEVVSLDDITRQEPNIRKSQIAITFDDGYFNNVDVVMPIMEKLDLPMTWFVATEFVDKPGLLPWWDMIDLVCEKHDISIELSEPEIAGVYDLGNMQHRNWFNKSLRALIKSAPLQRRNAIVEDLGRQIMQQAEIPENAFARPAEVAAIDFNRVELGGHSASHPNLAACDDPTRKQEIESGKSRLEEMSGQQLNWFAYPFGGRGSFDSATAESVRAAGFSGAVTLVSGLVHANTDRFKLPRIPISPALSLDAFKARILGAPVYVCADGFRAYLSARRG